MAMTRRNLILTLLLVFVTGGLYFLYWYCSVQNQIRNRTGRGFGGLGHLLMSLTVIYVIFWYFVIGSRIGEAGGVNRGPLYGILLFVPFSGLVVMVMMQNDINNIIDVALDSEIDGL